MKVHAVILGILLSVGLQETSAPTRAAAGSGDQATAYQLNVAHTGYLTGDTLAPPLVKQWSVNLGGAVSYPLIANGTVFVTVGNVSNASGPNYGSTLYALNEGTGATEWSAALGGTYYWSGATYDAGDVFALNYNGLLRAFNAGTGALLWTVQLPGQSAFSSPPVAANGVVYTAGAGSGGTLYAVSETNGSVLWTASVMNGDNSSPALSDTGVYVSYACAQTYDFSQANGSQVWHYAGPCEGGGGRTPVLSGGRLYVRDWASTPAGYAFDSGAGSLLNRFTAGPAPAFVGTTGLVLSGGTLTAQDWTSASNPSTLWSFAGDGSLDSAPVMVNNDVYVGSSSGTLYALDLVSGQQVWSAGVGTGIPAPDEQNVSQPLTGLGAGEGHLLVPAGSTLTAFISAPPAVTATNIAAVEGAPFSGTVATFTDPSPGATTDTATIAWGDGTTSAGTVAPNNSGGYTVTGSHAYAEEGNVTVRVTVTGSSGLATALGTASVADSSLSSSGYTVSAVAKRSFTARVAAFTDSDSGCAVGDYTATVQWGDGTTSTGTVTATTTACAFGVSGGHAYSSPGTYTTVVTVQDAGGSQTSARGSVSVQRH